MATLKTLRNGDEYYKSSDCLTWTIREEKKKPREGFLTALTAPARRALENNSIKSLTELSGHTSSKPKEEKLSFKNARR